MTTTVPRTRSIRYLDDEELAQLNDELHPLACDCPDCRPDLHDAAELAIVAVEVAA